MAKNNISLSVDPKSPPKGYQGPWKVRWREDIEVDGARKRVSRSRVVSDKGARDALVGRLRRQLEVGEPTAAPPSRVVVTAANLEQVALSWLRWQASRNRKASTRKVYLSAIKKIMAAIRAERGIRADGVIPVTVLDVSLYTDLNNRWIREDLAAVKKETKKGAASPMRRYDLSGFLYQIWSHGASQPATFPAVPALVDSALVIPPVPARPGAPDAPTWAECDVIVRRAYDASYDLGDLLAGQRLTGLRVGQVQAIRRRALDPVRRTLLVEVGKSQTEEAEARTIPIPPLLVELWQARIASAKGPDDFLFPAKTASGHTEADTGVIATLWRAAEDAGEIRRGLYKPIRRRKGRPNHGFRAGYIAGLQDITVEIDGVPVQRLRDRTIDFLVGHHPQDTRGRHYAPPTWTMLVAAVGCVPPMDLGGEKAAADNVVPLQQGP
ncbi:MAG: hypothetical protein V4850_30690 [Myxococcota bacterium]